MKGAWHGLAWHGMNCTSKAMAANGGESPLPAELDQSEAAALDRAPRLPWTSQGAGVDGTFRSSLHQAPVEVAGTNGNVERVHGVDSGAVLHSKSACGNSAGVPSQDALVQVELHRRLAPASQCSIGTIVPKTFPSGSLQSQPDPSCLSTVCVVCLQRAPPPSRTLVHSPRTSPSSHPTSSLCIPSKNSHLVFLPFSLPPSLSPPSLPQPPQPFPPQTKKKTLFNSSHQRPLFFVPKNHEIRPPRSCLTLRVLLPRLSPYSIPRSNVVPSITPQLVLRSYRRSYCASFPFRLLPVRLSQPNKRKKNTNRKLNRLLPRLPPLCESDGASRKASFPYPTTTTIRRSRSLTRHHPSLSVPDDCCVTISNRIRVPDIPMFLVDC